MCIVIHCHASLERYHELSSSVSIMLTILVHYSRRMHIQSKHGHTLSSCRAGMSKQQSGALPWEKKQQFCIISSLLTILDNTPGIVIPKYCQLSVHWSACVIPAQGKPPLFPSAGSVSTIPNITMTIPLAWQYCQYCHQQVLFSWQFT
jgi:hypothetical protein